MKKSSSPQSARELASHVNASVYSTRCALSAISEISIGADRKAITVSGEHLACLFELFAEKLQSVDEQSEKLESLVSLFSPQTFAEAAQ